MACLAERAVAHKQLWRCLRTVPSVEYVDYILPADSLSGHPETEIIAGSD